MGPDDNIWFADTVQARSGRSPRRGMYLDDPRGAKDSSGVVSLHQHHGGQTQDDAKARYSSKRGAVRHSRAREGRVSTGHLAVALAKVANEELPGRRIAHDSGCGRPLASAAPALAASPLLSWASPVRADDQPPFESSTAITDVSCPSTGLCVAVDGAGDVLGTTDPTGDAGAWAIAASVAKGFEGVSCPSSELCVAVGDGDVATSTDPTGGAGAWSVASLIPAASRIPNKPNRLDAVSCPSARLCVATDDDGNVWTSTDPTGGVAAWTETNVDGPEKILSGVSCPTESLCVAVDRGGGDVLTSTDPSGGGAHGP